MKARSKVAKFSGAAAPKADTPTTAAAPAAGAADEWALKARHATASQVEGGEGREEGREGGGRKGGRREGGREEGGREGGRGKKDRRTERGVWIYAEEGDQKGVEDGQYGDKRHQYINILEACYENIDAWKY